MEQTFHQKLRQKMDTYAHDVYRVSRQFPKEERYGVASQIRRASLSVILNYIEGFARGREKVHLNFLEISYGSLQESKYLLGFCCKEGFLSQEDFNSLLTSANEIGAMLWSVLRKLRE